MFETNIGLADARANVKKNRLESSSVDETRRLERISQARIRQEATAHLNFLLDNITTEEIREISKSLEKAGRDTEIVN